jgi:hypothetical protein
MSAPRRRRVRSEHGPIRCVVRVGPENPVAFDALRILARLLAARARQNPPGDLPSSADLSLTVPRGVAS